MIARSIKSAVGYRCMVCDRLCRRPGELWLGWDYELHVAHLSQDYTAPVVTVAALCGACHFRHDSTLSWVARRRVERWRQREAGQLALFTTRGQHV